MPALANSFPYCTRSLVVVGAGIAALKRQVPRHRVVVNQRKTYQRPLELLVFDPAIYPVTAEFGESQIDGARIPVRDPAVRTAYAIVFCKAGSVIKHELEIDTLH